MPDLVTLNSAPYNPYNDTFARFAMQGLQMGMQMMEQKDSLAQRKSEQLQSQVSEATQNAFKGVELQMRNKEMVHRFENDAFNQHLDQEKFKFSQDSFWKNIAMQEDERNYQRTQDATVNNPYRIAVTKGIEDTNKLNALTFDDRVQATHIKLAADAQALAMGAQQLQGAALTNQYNSQTLGSRVAEQNLAPAKTALGLAASAAEAAPYLNDPTLATRKANADVAVKEAQAASDLGRADYYKNGGADRAKAAATAGSVSSMVSAQANLFKNEKSLASSVAADMKDVKLLESGLKDGSMNDKEKKLNEDKIKALKDGMSEKETQLRVIRAQLSQVVEGSNKTFEYYNESLKKRGKQPIDVSKLSDEEKMILALELKAQIDREDAASSGNLPGSQAAPTPADRAVQDAQAGKPILRSSSNPPTSKYKALDFTTPPRSSIGNPGTDYQGGMSDEEWRRMNDSHDNE